MPTDEEKTPERELTAIRPSKVSLVDRGANGQFFFIAKSASEEDISDENTYKNAVLSFSHNILNRIETTREWLMNADTDSESEVPVAIMNMLSRTRDEADFMTRHVESGGAYLTDVKVSGAIRDKMVTKLDVVAEKLASSLSLLKSDDEEIPTEFIDSLKSVVGGFDIILENENDNIENKSDESEQEEQMTIKFEDIAKSADKVELDEVEVIKQIGSASTKLTEIRDMFKIDVTEQDPWEMRWQIGQAIDMLVHAAKLEDLLGSSTEKTADAVSTKDVEKEDIEMTQEEKSSMETKTEETPVETPAVSEAPTEETPSSEETPIQKSEEKQDDMVTLLKSVVSEAVTPLVERLDAIEKSTESTTEKVEKMERTRPAAKGGSPDETTAPVEKKASEPESLFTELMPPHLRGTVTR